MIAKDKEADILRLYHGEKWPIGTIAAQLGLHHTTVQRVLGQAGVDPKVVAPRPSMVDPFVPFIVEQLSRYPSLRSSRLFGMLKERGYPGGPDHLRRVIGRLRPKKPAEAFQRLRTLPGEQAQVDWAHFGKMAVGRALRPLWAFVMVLSYSRRIFLRFFPGAAMPFFVRGHVEAFADFDGVPRVLLCDYVTRHVIAHDSARYTAKECEGAAVAANPVRSPLAARRLGVRVAGGAEHGDEQLDLGDGACGRVHEGRLLPRVVHEHLLARDVHLAHHQAAPREPRPVPVAERGVPEAVGMLPQILQVQ
ncbi:hypothetical protein [Sorangium sp. So ce124]|uniref:hypothetical protein n=1 Tax=Sorangium sp. So ce124 TaxID=3133280 RepID=UPI003F61732C